MSEERKVKVIIDGQTVEKEVVMKQDGFNGETGEPAMVEMVANGFDGETGAAVYSPIIQNGFDGETGEPVYVIKSSEEEADTVVSSSKNPISSKAIKIIGIAAAAVVVLAAIVFGALKSGMFLSKQDKILLATYETIKDDTILGTALDAAKILENDSLSTEINGEISSRGYTANYKGEIDTCRSNAQLYALGNIEVAGLVNQKGEFYFDDSKIQFALPDIKKTVYEYDYTKENTGFLVSEYEKDTNNDIEDLNETISAAVEVIKLSDEYKTEVTKNVRKAAKKIKITNASKETFEIDGKERKCKGYKVTITGDNVIDILEAYRNSQNKVYGDAYERLNNALARIDKAGAPNMNIDSEIDKLENEAEFMDDMEFIVYLYKGKLAAITADVEDAKVSIEFQGGDTRTSNIAIIAKSGSEKVSIKRKSSITDKKEKGSFVYDGSTVLNYSYDKESGKIRVESDGVSLTGNFLVKGNSIICTYNGNLDGVTADVNVKVSKGGRISDLSGEVFDLGNADEDELKDEVDDIKNELVPIDDFDL